MIKVLTAILVCASPFSAIAAEADPEAKGRQQFEQWFNEISNWGRWGKDDELGTLNLITPDVKTKAAGLVKQGITVSLARDLDTVKSKYNPHPFEQETSVISFGQSSHCIR